MSRYLQSERGYILLTTLCLNPKPRLPCRTISKMVPTLGLKQELHYASLQLEEIPKRRENS